VESSMAERYTHHVVETEEHHFSKNGGKE